MLVRRIRLCLQAVLHGSGPDATVVIGQMFHMTLRIKQRKVSTSLSEENLPKISAVNKQRGGGNVEKIPLMVFSASFLGGERERMP